MPAASHTVVKTPRIVRQDEPARAIEHPKQIGPWRIVSLAGQGAWTCVYRAAPLVAPPGSPADYALKVIRPDRATDPMASRLLQREEYVGRQVSHPHLSPVLSSRVDRPPFYLATPFLVGATLAELLVASRTSSSPPGLAAAEQTDGATDKAPFERFLRIGDGLWFARQVAEAIEALHSAGWMHGDVKPANVFVGASGHATLIDLGFARRVGPDVDAHAVPWKYLPLMGTPAYSAPEVHLAREDVGRPADVYSLGVTLFESLAGRLPFEATEPAALATAHCQAAPPDVRDLRSNVPRDAALLVSRMLAKDHVERPAIGDVLAELIDLEIATLDLERT